MKIGESMKKPDIKIDWKKYLNKDTLKSFGLGVLQLAIIVAILVGFFFLGKGTIDRVVENDALQVEAGDVELEETLPEETTVEELAAEKDSYQGAYYLYVSLKLNAIIVYGYDDDGEKYAMRVMNCTIGPNIKKGKYEIKSQYAMVMTQTDNWNLYNSQIGERLWIQSASYTSKFRGSLVTKEYNLITQTNKKGANIRMAAGDARWIYTNCSVGTTVEVGNSTDLPLERPEFTKLRTSCKWDPTDPSKNNPWNQVANNTIAAYGEEVAVERGEKISYLAHVIAYDKDGNDVTKELKYKKIDTKELGTYKVKYTYGSGKNKIKATVTYVVKDTKAPEVTVDYGEKEYLVVKVQEKNYTDSYINSEKFKKKLMTKIKKSLTIIEGGTEVVLYPKKEADADSTTDETKDADSVGETSSETVAETETETETESETEPAVVENVDIQFAFDEKIYGKLNLVELTISDDYGNSGTTYVYFYIQKTKNKEETTTEEETTKKSKKKTKKETTKETTTKKSTETTTKQQTTTKKSTETTTKQQATTKKSTETTTRQPTTTKKSTETTTRQPATTKKSTETTTKQPTTTKQQTTTKETTQAANTEEPTASTPEESTADVAQEPSAGDE
jgi:hypothetical protein